MTLLNHFKRTQYTHTNTIYRWVASSVALYCVGIHCFSSIRFTASEHNHVRITHHITSWSMSYAREISPRLCFCLCHIHFERLKGWHIQIYAHMIHSTRVLASLPINLIAIWFAWFHYIVFLCVLLRFHFIKQKISDARSVEDIKCGKARALASIHTNRTKPSKSIFCLRCSQFACWLCTGCCYFVVVSFFSSVVVVFLFVNCFHFDVISININIVHA